MTLKLNLDSFETAGSKIASANESGDKIVIMAKGAPEIIPDDIFGSCLGLDGVDDWLDLGNPVLLQNIGSQTVQVWIRPDTVTEKQGIYTKDSAGEGAVNLGINGKLSYCDSTLAGQGFESNAVIEAGVWTHCAIVRDLSSQKLFWYINGKPDN